MNKVEKEIYEADEEEHESEEIKIRETVDSYRKYLLLDLVTDERWIIDGYDNYEEGQKIEDFQIYYDVISTNTNREIKDSDGDYCIDTFVEENPVLLIELDKEEPEVNSEGINELVKKIKKKGIAINGLLCKPKYR